MAVNLSGSVPFALLAGSVVLTAFMALKPVPDKPLAAVFPPWWSAARVMTAAAGSDGNIVRFGGFRTILVPAAGGPDLAGRLHRAGAWLVIDAGTPGGCGAQ